eukprot:PLAT12677.1.p4 GENE.PLAT12677.1~~PLAT12677.1.p4  ORF type:complete len:145 (+),score=47.05 PLAT12677.1:328-762(+)
MLVDGVSEKIDVLDTAAQECSHPPPDMRDPYMLNARCFLFVYSISNAASFDALASFKWRFDRLDSVADKAIVIVGAKCDLQAERQVTVQQGEKLAADWGCSFFETSAKSGVRVAAPFECLIRRVREIEATPPRAKPRPTPCLIS